MYKRDVAIVLLSCIGLMLSLQNEGTFSFRKAWYHDVAPPKDLPGASEYSSLPPPLVADLNGDGRLEVVIATHDLRLQVIRPQAPGRAGEGFAPAAVVAEVSLLPQKISIGSDRRPVAMAAGYLDPDPAEMVRPLRKQVLVVVTAGWQVLCFDHNLALLWEASVQYHLRPHTRLREVAVHISSHQVQVGDRGLVVVGGSLELGDLGAAERGQALGGGGSAGGRLRSAAGGGGASQLEGVLEEERRFEAELGEHARGGAREGAAAGDGSGGAGALGGVDVSRHFDYIAYEGGSGVVRWRHDGASYHKAGQEEEEEGGVDALQPQHNFRLDAERLNERHFGEVSCREFRESVLHSLPHTWGGPHDTRLEEALFVRHKEGAGAQKRHLASSADARASAAGRAASAHHRRTQSAATVSHLLGPRSTAARRTGASAAHAPAAQQGGPAHRHAHLASNDVSANALVAHLQEGIEAIHLFSGRMLCQLHLPEGVLHADLNGDGVIDHIAAASGEADAALRHVGNVRHASLGACIALATSGIPARERLWMTQICHKHGPGAWGALDSDKAGGDAAYTEFAPPAFLPVPRADGSYSHLRGQHGIVAFFGSDGAIGAYNMHGERLWQQHFGASWEGEETEATLLALPLLHHSVPAALLAIGSSLGVVVSEHGHLLAEFKLPAPLAQPAVVADYDGNGLNDIIIVTSSGVVLGYTQVHHYGSLSFSALLLALIAAMGAVYYSQQHSAEMGDAGDVRGGAARVRKLRSTEYVD